MEAELSEMAAVAYERGDDGIIDCLINQLTELSGWSQKAHLCGNTCSECIQTRAAESAACSGGKASEKGSNSLIALGLVECFWVFLIQRGFNHLI